MILHGLFGSGSNWRRVARELATSYRVLAVDLRNHGASPWADSMSYLEMADDVLRLIERERLSRPAVIGHSMGGKVAMALALMYPKQVGRLTVVDIAPVPMRTACRRSRRPCGRSTRCMRPAARKCGSAWPAWCPMPASCPS